MSRSGAASLAAMAAMQPALPPPITRISVFIISISGFVTGMHLILF
jgi:hypothetical protein